MLPIRGSPNPPPPGPWIDRGHGRRLARRRAAGLAAPGLPAQLAVSLPLPAVPLPLLAVSLPQFAVPLPLPAVLLLLLALPLLLAACGSGNDGTAPHNSGQGENRSLSAAAGTGPDVARYLAGIPRVRVAGDYPRPFFVAGRTAKIGRFPCAGCHDRALGSLKALRQPRAPATHRDIAQPHAPASTLACSHCHDDGSGMNELRLMDGSKVAFDHSYRVCAQCHFQQARAWAGGGHGKRLAGWGPPRVVMNCTACHNPHDPLRPVSTPRWPAIVPNAPARRTTHGE